MRRGLAIVLTAAVAGGCGETGDPVQQVPEGAVIEAEGAGESSDILSPDAAAGPDAIEVISGGGNPRFDPSCLITEASAAGIAMPETLGEFVSAFPQGTVLSFYPNYMVDFGKLCLRAGGEDALCADFESYDVEAYSADIPVVGLSLYARQCRTVDGIGPGSAVGAAVDAYGAPTFAFNYDNEGREYVRFADQPEGYVFRARSAAAEGNASSTGVPNGPYAGDYEGVAGDGSYFETGAYHSDGEIWEVFLSAPFEPTE